MINLPAPALPIAGEMLITAFAGTRLRHELDRIPLWQGDDVGVRALWELFAQYVYLPRLRDQSVSGLDVG